ncbi:acid-sensing ion channel 1B-like isoform X1 [Lytechinus pictus]|uniref:acid-sensing ion channel 1B-like isoform X1 n=1 Tax=Lytechinus pictus TaxID=7653 RepID=UPI0030B9AF8E
MRTPLRHQATATYVPSCFYRDCFHLIMNGNDIRIPSTDDVSIELEEAYVEAPPQTTTARIESRSHRRLLFWSWWIALSRSAPEGIGVAGLKYALLPTESWCRRLGWLIILICAVTACTIMIAERSFYFASSPLSVDISVNQTSAELTFPKVVICNFNLFVKSKTQARPAVDKVLRIYENSRYNPNKNITLSEEEVEEIRKHDMTEIYNELKHTKEDMFIRVVFGGQQVLLEDIVPVFTTFGVCYQINDGQDGRKLLKAAGAGRAFGLSMILNVEQDKYYYNTFLKDAVGFSIHLLDQNDTTYLHQEGFQVGPGTSTAVSITARQIYNEEPPYGVCGETKLQYYYKYSRNKCLVECLAQAVVSACGCRTPSLPGNAPVCDAIAVGTCTNIFFEPRFQHGSLHLEPCECPLNCQERDFLVGVSTTKYPSHFRARLLEEYIRDGVLNILNTTSINSSYIEDNFVSIDLFFSDINTMVVTQKAAYTFWALMSDIGGSLGLWLGGSLLTLFEILDLCGHSFFSKTR